jgi:putative DeoR family transcriptional regulator (stage III sporulation protein D)
LNVTITEKIILYTRAFFSVSTVHKDVTERLGQINPSLANRARVVLDLNKSERHIRGGLATKEKYLHKTKYSQAY